LLAGSIDRINMFILSLWFPGSAWEPTPSGLRPERPLIALATEAEPPGMHSEAEPRNE